MHPIVPGRDTLVGKSGVHIQIKGVLYKDPLNPTIDTGIFGSLPLDQLQRAGYTVHTGITQAQQATLPKQRHNPLYNIGATFLNHENRVVITGVDFQTGLYHFTLEFLKTKHVQTSTEPFASLEKALLQFGFKQAESLKQYGYVVNPAPKINKCTCGSDAVKSPMHSSWCDKEVSSVLSSGVAKNKAS
jgi:hypothetical protein